jgi:hypothetical protein
MSRQRGLVLAVLVVCLAVPPAPAQEDMRVGTQALRRILFDQKLTPLTNWLSLRDDPKSSILLLLGETTDGRGGSLLDAVPGGLEAFVQQGGAVLVATDSDLRHNALERLTGCVVDGHHAWGWVPGQPATMRMPPRFVYRGLQGGLPECLVAQPTGNGPPLFMETGRPQTPLSVVTNRAGFLETTHRANQLRLRRERVHVVANLPGKSWFQHGDTYNFEVDPRPFAITREAGGGRLLLTADHSVFINEMLLQVDNGNFKFAVNAVAWLKDEKRTRVLLVVDGTIQSPFDVRFKNPDLRDLQAQWAAIGDNMLLDWQEQHKKTNEIDDLAAGVIDNGPGDWIFGHPGPRNLYLFLVLAAALGMLFYGLLRLLRASHGPEAGVPLFENAVHHHRPARSAPAIKRRYALAEDDMRGFAREAAREWWASLPGSPPGGPLDAPPVVEAEGGWLRRRRLTRELHSLWCLAYDDELPWMSLESFRRLLARLETLRDHLKSGEVRVHFTRPPGARAGLANTTPPR